MTVTHHPEPVVDDHWQGEELAADDTHRYLWMWQGFNIRLIAIPHGEAGLWSYDHAWCYPQDPDAVREAVAEWDPDIEDEPAGWHKRPTVPVRRAPRRDEAPIPDPEHRIPWEQHTEDTLTELYDRLEDAESFGQELRDVARACSLAYTAAVPALLGVQIALEHLRTRITLDSRDWAADKLDAWLWAVLVGWNCENTNPDHVHNDIDCNGDQALWDIGRQHDIPTDQVIQAGQHRWWVANAIKVAKEIKEKGED